MPTTVGISFFKSSPKGELSYKVKKTAPNAVFLGEGIFTMGYSKNYI